MTKVLVLAGGSSDERAVSLRSGASVVAALQAAGYQTVQADPAETSLESSASDVDVAFPVLHGKGGEDGEIQAILDSLEVPYVGANPRVSELCFDKWQYKQALQAADIPTPVGALVTAANIWQSPLTQMPFVLKPYDGGSSIDTFIVRHPADVDIDAVSDAFTRHDMMLLEELIDGIEITVGVVGTEPLPVIEIVPPAGGEFDYENKYNGASAELCPPEHVSAAEQEQARQLTYAIHELLGIDDWSRTDMMLTADGHLYVIETNTLPGMTEQSLLPRAAAVAGYDMPKLVSVLVESALARIRN